MSKLRLAVVGAGSEPGCRTWGYLAVIRKLADMLDLCAISDADEGRSKRAAAEYAIPGVYTDLDTMLSTEKPDVVVRMTPTDSCVGVSVRAAEHGCHVFNEIPIAPTLPMADRIIDACEASNVKLEVAENVWLWPQERLKRKVIEAGLLGKLVHARLTYPCGVYHGMNAIRMLTGQEVRSVLGYAARVEVEGKLDYPGNPMPSAFFESGTLKFRDFTCLYELPPKNRAWRRHWDIEGTRGFLEADDLYLYDGDNEVRYPIETLTTEVGGETVLESVRYSTDPPIVWENPYARYGISDMDDIAKAALLESLYVAVTEDVEPIYGAVNSRRDQEIAIAIRESDLLGNVWVDLPLTEVTQVEEQIHDAFRKRYGCDPVEDIEAQLHAEYDRNAVMWNELGWL